LQVRLLFLFAIGALLVSADPAIPSPESVIDQFVTASREQERALAGASMEIDIRAALPKLKKEGRLHALRRISSLGRITYERLMFEGDGTVKKNVIARYLTAEAQSQENDDSPSLAVTPENYKFKYKGAGELDGRAVHILQVTPRRKRVGLFKGEIWVDAATYLRVRESGRFVKTPSIFLKRVEFVRTYEIRDGISVPRSIETVVQTRLVGKAELNIEFTNFSLDPPAARVAAAGIGGL
jgi:hypothetical protein